MGFNSQDREDKGVKINDSSLTVHLLEKESAKEENCKSDFEY